MMRRKTSVILVLVAMSLCLVVCAPVRVGVADYISSDAIDYVKDTLLINVAKLVTATSAAMLIGNVSIALLSGKPVWSSLTKYLMTVFMMGAMINFIAYISGFWTR